MYHRIPGLICALILVAALMMSGPALADGIAYDAAQDTLTITHDKCISGGEYALLLLEPGTSSGGFAPSDVLFMDQLTADGEGRIEAIFISPDFDDFTAILGGTFSDGAASPRTIGYYSPASPRKVLDMPSQLREIGESAFEGGSFTHVYLGEDVRSIGARAFADCADLVYIYIPETTVSIAEDAFTGCGSLTVGCRAGSAALAYAQAHSMPYRIIE